jgi:hypothetical protein
MHRGVSAYITARLAADILADILIQETLSSTLFLAMTVFQHSGSLAC